ncbi:hypothetical protein G9A89_011605 [Geosiphon pyriformis]|nr:hypothetical protein G9A89_011605 [Geosiphon pyriformis]
MLGPEMRPTLMVSMELNNRFAALECNLTSLAECINKLAKKLDLLGPMVSQSSPGCQPLITFLSQNQEANIVMNEGSSVATGGETIAGVAVFDSSVVSKMEDTLNNLSIMVMGLLAKIDNADLQEDIVWWHRESKNMMSIIINRFDEVCIFTSGLDNRFLGAEVVIVMNNSLTQHVSKVKEISGHVISVCLLFKGKILVSVVVNSSNFVVLSGNFNKGKSIKSASFGFCLSLGLVNSFGGHFLAEASMWSNLKGIEKVIDHIFVSGSLILAVASHRVESMTEFFNTDYKAVSVSVGLGGLLDMRLDGICRNTNRDYWKFKLKNVNTDNWGCFIKCSSDKFLEKLVVFHDAEHSGDLNGMWDVLREVTIDSADVIFSRLWFSKFDSIRNKISSKFHGLKLLMFKIVNSMKTTDLDNDEASKIKIIINRGTRIENIVHHISVVKKRYCRSKYHESKIARNESIRVAMAKHMENFCSDKRRIIKNILDQSFRKIVLNYLIVDDELILELQAVKSSVDIIIEDWIRKCLVSGVFPDWWLD